LVAFLLGMEVSTGEADMGHREGRMKQFNYLVIERGVTLIELLIVISIIGILATIGVPEISRFSADYKVRSAATDLIQNMKVTRAMAIKENREYVIVFDTANQRYLMGFDGDDLDVDGDPDGDGDLITVDSDTFGICKDTDNDRLPEGDISVNGVPECVRIANISDYGSNVIFGYSTGTTPPNGPNGTAIPASGINFTGVPPTAEFDIDGSADKLGSVYLQHAGRGYSYCVRISNNSGSINMWRWDGDKDNTGVTTWTELR
jgi:prepilin-type N-terminal cleavage/methylation domain-containing protein